MVRKLLMFGGFAMAMAFMGGTAKADTLTYTQTVTFGSGTATAYLTISSSGGVSTATLTFGSDLNNYYTSEIAIQPGTGATLTGTSYNDPSNNTWTLQTGNNAVQCQTTPGNWFCGYSANSSSFQGLSFTWTFTGSISSSPSVQFSICNSNIGTNTCFHGQTGFLTNFSQSGPVNTPEPGTLYLLGAGLLPLLLFGRRLLG